MWAGSERATHRGESGCEFANFAEMKRYLVALMIYDYGRSVGFTDRELVARRRNDGYGLRDLLTSIVLSEPFLTK